MILKKHNLLPSLAFGLSPNSSFCPLSRYPVTIPLCTAHRSPWKACATEVALSEIVPSKKATTIISWNVNSLRALLRKDPQSLQKLVQKYQPDLLCLQVCKRNQKTTKTITNVHNINNEKLMPF